MIPQNFNGDWFFGGPFHNTLVAIKWPNLNQL